MRGERREEAAIPTHMGGRGNWLGAGGLVRECLEMEHELLGMNTAQERQV